MSRTLRYLRIAWTVSCGIVCLFLIALWVRSYVLSDYLVLKSLNIEIDSLFGVLCIYQPGTLTGDWIIESASIEELRGVGLKRNPLHYLFAFRFHEWIVMPHWFVAFGFGSFAAVPWLRWRYSLGTLLIATTLVAIGLGTIIALSR
jgi:hypothetical protein